MGSSLKANGQDQFALSANHGISPGSQRRMKIACKSIEMHKSCKIAQIQSLSKSCIISKVSNSMCKNKIQRQAELELQSPNWVHIQTIQKAVKKKRDGKITRGIKSGRSTKYAELSYICKQAFQFIISRASLFFQKYRSKQYINA